MPANEKKVIEKMKWAAGNDMLPFEDTEKEKTVPQKGAFLCGRETYPLKDLLKQ